MAAALAKAAPSFYYHARIHQYATASCSELFQTTLQQLGKQLPEKRNGKSVFTQADRVVQSCSELFGVVWSYLRTARNPN